MSTQFIRLTIASIAAVSCTFATAFAQQAPCYPLTDVPRLDKQGD